jgi:putative glycolipid-binding protein
MSDLLTGPRRLARAHGRYVVFHGGVECGEERWRIEEHSDGVVVTGVQEMAAPFPFPNRQEFRVTLTSSWRVTGVEIEWTVRDRRVSARHSADGARWRVHIDYAGEVKQQEGDYPAVCEVDYVTPLFLTFLLARRDFQLGGEHEFPVLRIGPPWMAVTPERMLMRCVEIGTLGSVVGEVPARRYIVSLPPRSEAEGYSFWADDQGLVLESYEGLETDRPWMRLVECRVEV